MKSTMQKPANIAVKISLALFLFIFSSCSEDNLGEDGMDPNASEDGTTPFEVTLHSNKNVVSMVLPNSISIDDPDEFDAGEDAIVEKLYESFDDVFDWVILVTNSPENPGFEYSGRSTNGHFGFAPNLKGYIHMTTTDGIKHGPMMHELGHRWTPHKGLYLYSGFDEAPGLHPDADGRDPLGGGSGSTLHKVTVSDPSSLEPGTVVADAEDADKLATPGYFEAERFGQVANGGNSIPYNGESMFEMGFISWDQAGFVWVPTNAEAVISVSSSDGTNFTRFSADAVVKMSIKDYETNIVGITEDNPVDNAQSFKILVVLIDNKAPSEEEFNLVSEHTEWLTLAADDGDDGLFNFWEATNGLGTLISESLDENLK